MTARGATWRSRALAALLLLAPAPAAAQLAVLGESNEPLAIDASEGIEWRSDEQVYIARGNARAAQGDIAVNADLLQAHYRETGDDGTDIWRVDAIGNVLITTGSETIEGDQAVYNLDTGIFELTGETLRIVGEEQTVVARDLLIYHRNEQMAQALGDATVTEGDRSIRADVLTAWFGEDATGEMALDRAEATGDVIVTTPTEVARARRANYDAANEIVSLSGGVRLTRGRNQLNGEYAEVNLRTGISRLLARPRGASGGQPVRALLVPGDSSAGDLDIGLPGAGNEDDDATGEEDGQESGQE